MVTIPVLFDRITVEQLRSAFAEPIRWVGCSVPQLLDRTAQVGIVVMLDQGDREQ